MWLPDRLRATWNEVDNGLLRQEEAQAQQERELDGYRKIWQEALIQPGEPDLRRSLLREVAEYYGVSDLEEVDRLCTNAVSTMRQEWEQQIDPSKRTSIESFYQSATMVHDLMGWHSLRDDPGPLGSVLGLEVAQGSQVRSCLDFGSGVGSGALLFTHAGIHMTLADISTTLLDFARWRFTRRALAANFLDLNTHALPTACFDMILAMDVFEHLVDPVDAMTQLWRALRPGGLFFGRIQVEDAGTHPQHIVRDFEPTFARMRELGLVEIWRDTWLWGHQLFRKQPG
jgi:2-polyprenyl-3-methyl-5-hydroxy-6-metoxy-1,4-benzoquinol methylase